MTVAQMLETYDFALPVTVAAVWNNDQIPVYTVGIEISTEFTGSTEDGVADNVVPWCKTDQVAEAGGKPKNQAPGMFCPETTTDAEDFYAVSNQIQLSAMARRSHG